MSFYQDPYRAQTRVQRSERLQGQRGCKVAEGGYDKRNSLISSTSEQCDLPRIKRSDRRGDGQRRRIPHADVAQQSRKIRIWLLSASVVEPIESSTLRPQMQTSYRSSTGERRRPLLPASFAHRSYGSTPTRMGRDPLLERLCGMVTLREKKQK